MRKKTPNAAIGWWLYGKDERGMMKIQIEITGEVRHFEAIVKGVTFKTDNANEDSIYTMLIVTGLMMQ